MSYSTLSPATAPAPAPAATTIPATHLPVTVLVSILGAGKTTPLNYLLAERADRKLAVIVNDFSAITSTPRWSGARTSTSSS